ncbi:MAG: hypothetical protein U0871_01090 [Gemmataceae bacterium]
MTLDTAVGAITGLARSFPCLTDARGLDPWHPRSFDLWGLDPARSFEARYAVALILNVWNSRYRWSVGPFDAVYALLQWDDADRAAFLDYAADPFWINFDRPDPRPEWSEGDR